jgi:GT2 family glycosyltransferase
LNAGLEYVFGSAIPYIGRLDSDDVALAGRFRRQLDFMERNPSVGICGGSYQECTPDGRLGAVIRLPGSDAGIRRGMHLRTTLWHPTVLIRTAVARQVGLFDPALACEDVDYFLRILDISRGANVSDAVIIYETGAADALTGTASRRRTLARDLLRLKWHRRAPFDPFWWLGLLALGSYTLGINRQLPVLRAMVLRALDRKAI